MDFENFDDEKNVSSYLNFFTNHFYSFAVSSERVWSTEEIEHIKDNEPFYQLMPDSLDDGFFDWYCYMRPNNQFFKSKEMCVLYFVYYWTDWKRKGKPNWATKIDN